MKIQSDQIKSKNWNMFNHNSVYLFDLTKYFSLQKINVIANNSPYLFIFIFFFVIKDKILNRNHTLNNCCYKIIRWKNYYFKQYFLVNSKYIIENNVQFKGIRSTKLLYLTAPEDEFCLSEKLMINFTTFLFMRVIRNSSNY